MTEFVASSGQKDKIKDILDDVLFLSAQQCHQREEEMKTQIIASLDGLKWPKDPQRVLKDKLRSGQDEDKKEVFISIYKSL